MSLTWSDLLPEILANIAGKFEFYEDIVNFLAVCSSWRSSTGDFENLLQRHPSRFPCLLLSYSNSVKQENRRSFFLLSNGGTFRNLNLPEARRQRCISANGWLLATGEEEFAGKLIDPFSRTQIDLPELYMFDELYSDRDEWMYYIHSMRKFVLTSSNPKSGSFRVIIIWGKTLAFCKLSDDSWTRINNICDKNLFDMTYHNVRKRLYVVANKGTIYEYDIFSDESRQPRLRRLSAAANFSVSWAYLLEWGDESLLMVTREWEYYKRGSEEYGRHGPYRTKKFQAFVFNLDHEKWSKVESLGNKAVFVGFNSSFAVKGSNETKPNCIYFTDDVYESCRGLPKDGGGDVGVYRMIDGGIEPIFDRHESLFHAPLWLQPKPSYIMESF